MRIVIISDWFAEKMGYSENLLPRALASLGAEVHLVTSDLQPPFADYKEIYEPFIGPRQQPVGVFQIHGFTVHRLPHGSQWHSVYIRGLHQILKTLRPDIVQCFTLPSFSTYQAAFAKLRFSYKLFLEEHIHKSVFQTSGKLRSRLFHQFQKHVIIKLLATVSEKCYPIAEDVSEIVVQYFGYPASKVEICPLGVDTERFTPPETPEQLERRQLLRKQLGFEEQDLVCLYSGRFSPDKNPQCLATAIDRLQDHQPRFKGLFLGSGTPAQVEAITHCRGCVVHPFVPWTELPDYYRAADIGVWPKQESTSQLDAAATGLPLILSNRIRVTERVDGNGFLYEEDDPDDMFRKLLNLGDDQIRRPMQMHGIRKVREKFSWESIARKRLQDYTTSIKKNG